MSVTSCYSLYDPKRIILDLTSKIGFTGNKEKSLK